MGVLPLESLSLEQRHEIVTMGLGKVLGIAPIKSDHGLRDIEQLDRTGDDFSFAVFGMRDDRWRIDDFLVEIFLRVETVVTGHRSLIRDEDNDRILPKTTFVELIHKPANQRIHHGDHREVTAAVSRQVSRALIHVLCKRNRQSGF